jgi:hypothetical protein
LSEHAVKVVRQGHFALFRGAQGRQLLVKAIVMSIPSFLNDSQGFKWSDFGRQRFHIFMIRAKQAGSRWPFKH